jgi:hypothetical protein
VRFSPFTVVVNNSTAALVQLNTHIFVLRG